MNTMLRYFSTLVVATCFTSYSFGQLIAPNPAPKSDKPDYSNNQILTSEDMYVEQFHEYLIYDKTVEPRWIINRYDGVLECYDADFQKTWSFTPEDTELLNNGRNQFYYQDGVLFTAYMTGYIYAINARNGSLFWEAKIGLNHGKSVLRGQSLTPYQGKLFLSSNNSNVYAINGSDGALLWNYQLAYPYNHLPTLVLNDTVYLQNAPYMYSFVAGSGKPLYQRGFPKAMYGKPVTNGNLIVIPNESTTIYGLAPTDMAPVWEFEIGEDEFRVGTKIFAEGTNVYFASSGSHSGVYCLTAATGQLNWKSSVEGGIAFIMHHDDHIYGYTAEKALFMLTMDEGHIELFHLHHQPVSNLQVIDDHVYYYAAEGLIQFSLADRKQQVVIPFDGKEDEEGQRTNFDSQILFTD